VLVAFDPAAGSDATGLVTLVARDGTALRSVPVAGIAVAVTPTTTPTGPTPATDPAPSGGSTTPERETVETETAAPGAGAPSPGSGNGAAPTATETLTSEPTAAFVASPPFVAVLVGIGGLVLAVVGSGRVARRRARRRPRGRVGVRSHPDAGEQTVRPGPVALLGIRARTSPGTLRTTLVEGPETQEEARP
jgi:hypothetical protein